MELKGASVGAFAEEEDKSSLADLGSPAYLATVCAFATFQKMVASKTQSWAQVHKEHGGTPQHREHTHAHTYEPKYPKTSGHHGMIY